MEREKEVIAAPGMVLSVIGRLDSINSNSTLFRLVHLEILYLSDNDFNFSKIPHAIGQLSRLRSLSLWNSRFFGQVPSELLALSNLVILDLSGNTDLWGNFVLWLQKPSLTDLVQNLTYLKKVYLSEVNVSSTIPHSMATNLYALTHLFLDECGLQGEFQLVLANRRFSGELPTSIGRLGSLTKLVLGLCNFTGLIPSSLSHLT